MNGTYNAALNKCQLNVTDSMLDIVKAVITKKSADDKAEAKQIEFVKHAPSIMLSDVTLHTNPTAVMRKILAFARLRGSRQSAAATATAAAAAADDDDDDDDDDDNNDEQSHPDRPCSCASGYPSTCYARGSVQRQRGCSTCRRQQQPQPPNSGSCSDCRRMSSYQQQPYQQQLYQQQPYPRLFSYRAVRSTANNGGNRRRLAKSHKTPAQRGGGGGGGGGVSGAGVGMCANCGMPPQAPVMYPSAVPVVSHPQFYPTHTPLHHGGGLPMPPQVIGSAAGAQNQVWGAQGGYGYMQPGNQGGQQFFFPAGQEACNLSVYPANGMAGVVPGTGAVGTKRGGKRRRCRRVNRTSARHASRRIK
jgi:hypothetical protein